MSIWFEIATAVLLSLAAAAIWDFAVIAALRVVGVKLSFLLPFRVFGRRDRELFAAVPSKNA